MKKILTIIGARPQFIKASVVSRAINLQHGIKEIVVHTGQHFDFNMSDVFFSELGMNPVGYQLNIHGGGHGEMTGRMLIELEGVIQSERPDAVLVYGDTNSTFAGALAAAKLHIPIAHVEAGLRSHNMRMPEEINRVLTDRVSKWLFTPTEAAINHLISEGVSAKSIFSVGDVMYDAALHFGGKVYDEGLVLSRLKLKPQSYVLATIHRAENTDDLVRLQCIITALELVAQQLPVVWPMHPRTRAMLFEIGLLTKLHPQIRIVDPVGYLEMIQLEKYSAVIATDSGGVQKEAFFYKVPCVTLRNETEWSELLDAGWNRLAPPLNANIAAEILAAIGTNGKDIHPYGAGDAANKIVEQLRQDLVA